MGNCITYSLDKETGLSNGDEIKLTVNIDKDLASQYKLKMTTGEKTYTYTVSGLSEYEELDAFKDVGQPALFRICSCSICLYKK